MNGSGVWHQLGYNTHKLAQDVIREGIGQGVVYSAGDGKFSQHVSSAGDFQDLGVAIAFDPQFHAPNLTNTRLQTYPFSAPRNHVLSEHRAGTLQLDELAEALETTNRGLNASVMLSPSVCFEVRQRSLIELNINLFKAAKKAGDALGIPTYATVSVSEAVLSSTAEMNDVLSAITALNPDGFYVCMEFASGEFPNSESEVFNFGNALLSLRMSQKPVIHAYSGPLSLLSPGFGGTAVCLGPSMTLWTFARSRVVTESRGGGPGKIPPRFFSAPLWTRLVIPDDLDRIGNPANWRNYLVHSPFSREIENEATIRFVDWPQGRYNRHFVWTVGDTVKGLFDASPIQALDWAINHLRQAELHHSVLRSGAVSLAHKDETRYQEVWLRAAQKLRMDRSDDYSYLDLLGGL